MVNCYDFWFKNGSSRFFAIKHTFFALYTLHSTIHFSCLAKMLPYGEPLNFEQSDLNANVDSIKPNDKLYRPSRNKI